MMPRRSLSLSVVCEESGQTGIVRLLHSCAVQLLQMISISCARHADDMQHSAVNTFCSLLQSVAVSGYLANSGKLTLAPSVSVCVDSVANYNISVPLPSGILFSFVSICQ